MVPRFDADRLDFRPVVLEIFAEHLFLLVVEVCQKQGEDIAGAILEHCVVGDIESGDHRLEQVHLRILPARHRRRPSFQKAAVERAQLSIQKRKQRVDFGPDLRIAIEGINVRERKQYERVVICITLRV